MFACTAFVSNTLGQKFVEPPPLDLGDSLSDSVPHSPLLFILSAGIEFPNLKKFLLLATLKPWNPTRDIQIFIGPGELKTKNPNMLSILTNFLDF
jgi:dynein heavy chain